MMKTSILYEIKLVLILVFAAVLLCPVTGQDPAQPELAPAAMATAEPTVEPKTEMVWIPNTGARYHDNSRCSGMKNPEYASIQDAVNRGYTPCKNCY